MDQRTQAEFDRIIAKDPNDLNQDEIGFLRSRSLYLKKFQLEEYKDILEVKSQPSITEAVKTKHATK